MKKKFLLTLAALLTTSLISSLPASAANNIAAFPGAEGGGKYQAGPSGEAPGVLSQGREGGNRGCFHDLRGTADQKVRGLH